MVGSWRLISDDRGLPNVAVEKGIRWVGEADDSSA